mmetsp:Transcript_45002/g.48688  ORF Transcript_45002/g.48688 Transcript_45002/m.48688 type:complete len:85 (-) Transcript_45002:26-280(-)
MRGEIIKKNNRIIYISGTGAYGNYSLLLEFVTGELEDVPLLDVAVKRCDSIPSYIRTYSISIVIVMNCDTLRLVGHDVIKRKRR